MFMRYSKFKHVFSKPDKKEACYDSIKITKSSWDSTFCSVNPKFVAVITDTAGGGSFIVIPIEKTGRVEPNHPLVSGHRAPVLDIQWCPFNDYQIASASEDCTVKVWTIPEGGLPSDTNLTESTANLVGHQRRVGLLLWHPVAQDVLLSAGADSMIIIWDVARQSPLVEISHPDIVLSASFNFCGSKLVCATKDKNVRVLDPRNGKIIAEGLCHEGSKPQQVVYLHDDSIFTTGFSRMGERQLALWTDEELNKPVSMVDVDTENAVQLLFYDPETGLILISGKGDSTIRLYEVTGEEPYIHYLNSCTSPDPLRGWGFIPKRAIDTSSNEVARCYKLHARGLCEVLHFTVPRKSEIYQEDLYPPCPIGKPALTAEEWFQGKDANPLLMCQKDGTPCEPNPDVSPRPHLFQTPTSSTTKDGQLTVNQTVDTNSTRMAGDVQSSQSVSTAEPGSQSAPIKAPRRIVQKPKEKEEAGLLVAVDKFVSKQPDELAASDGNQGSDDDDWSD